MSLWKAVPTQGSQGSRQRVPATSRARPPVWGLLSDSTKQSRAYRAKYPVLVTGHTLEFTYSNFYNNGGPEADGPNSITVYSALEAPAGSTTYVPITPPGGIVLLPGENRTLTVPMEVTQGDDLWVRTQVSVGTLGQTWGKGNWHYYTGEGIVDTTAAPTTDITMTTAPGGFTTSAENGFGPSNITVLREGSAVTSVLIIGTSIAYGVGNTSGQDKSWVTEPLIAAKIPFQNVAMPSSSSAQFSLINGRRRKMAITTGVQHTHAVWEHLTNDAQPLATLQANAIIGWRALTARGMKVIACTGLPKTDAGNTTPSAQNAARIQYNNWLRDGAPMSAAFAPAAVGATGVLRTGQAGHPLIDYWEPADEAETARDSGLWKAGYTTDGVHPTTTGHTAIQAAVYLPSFLV